MGTPARDCDRASHQGATCRCSKPNRLKYRREVEQRQNRGRDGGPGPCGSEATGDRGKAGGTESQGTAGRAECQGGAVSQGGADGAGSLGGAEDHHGRADGAKNHQGGAEDNQSRAKDHHGETGGAEYDQGGADGAGYLQDGSSRKIEHREVNNGLSGHNRTGRKFRKRHLWP